MRFEEIKNILKKEFISFAYSFHYNLEAYLYPEEEAIIKQAVPLRQEEFAKGRQCARVAMEEIMGPTNTPILQGDFGEPLFSQSVVGSISHTERFFVSAVAFDFKMRAIGVDIEENLSRDIDWELIADRNELSQCNTYNITPITLFSIKESLIKCFSPLFQKRLFYDSFDVQFQHRSKIDIFNPVSFSYRDDPEKYRKQAVCGYFISENNYLVSIAFIRK